MILIISLQIIKGFPFRWLTDGRCDPDHPEFCNWWDCYSYKMKRDSGYGWKMMLFVLHTLLSIAFAGYEGK